MSITTKPATKPVIKTIMATPPPRRKGSAETPDFASAPTPTHRNSTNGQLNYRNSQHAKYPHVLKFSGGRSSAQLALQLAERGVLNPQRGDVVLFANTSAEHPGTYEFATKCKQLLEQKFQLPVFWYEFCTIEDAVSGQYRRRASYRLVKPVPFKDDPEGYRSGGEVFEEMLSFQNVLPNPLSRSCTAKLKLHPGHALLAEWFAATKGPAHDGHYADRSFIDLKQTTKQYRQNGGTASASQYMRYKEFVSACPTARPSQRWQDFTQAPILDNRYNQQQLSYLPSHTQPSYAKHRAELFGQTPAHFVTLLGLRADELRRVNRVMERTLFAEGAGGSKCQVSNQPPGEHPYFPLADEGIKAEDVLSFWKAQDFDLEIPQWAGNCVFCFMKGTERLRIAVRAEDEKRVPDTPSDVNWWKNIERRYRREAPARSGNGISKFGFLGVSGPSFAQVAAGNHPRKNRFVTGTPACDCTD